MSLPPTNSIEMPILQELAATGGTDEVQFLYERLIGYFPQIEDREIREIKNGDNKTWRKAVQKAGRILDEQNLIRRNRGLWTITAGGRETALAETSSFTLAATAPEPTTHSTVQQLLVEIGNFLGYAAETEYEYYDVVWRESRTARAFRTFLKCRAKATLTRLSPNLNALTRCSAPSLFWSSRRSEI
jgi:hypothetical protein